MRYGPICFDHGPEPSAFLPEGTHIVTMFTCEGVQRSDPHVLHVSVEPSFDILPVPWRGKAVITWPRVEGALEYAVYRALEASPSTFEKIAAVPASTNLYTDAGLGDATYLYAVGAQTGGQWSVSRVESTHPFRTYPKANYPPVIYSPPVTCATAGVEYAYDVNASDPYRDELAYSLVGPPPGMAIDAKTGLITWKPAAAGDYEIVVKARDCKGLCHVQRFIVEVDELPELNRDPDAEAGGPYAVEAGRAIGFDGTASFDPDGDPLSFAWSFGDGTSGSGCCPNHTYSSPGSYQVALTVSDGRGGTATDHAIAAVEACMTPTVTLSASPAAVPPGGACTLAWSSGNASLVAIDHGIGTVPASGTITVHPDIDTTYTATATSPCGMAADSITVTVHRILGGHHGEPVLHRCRTDLPAVMDLRPCRRRGHRPWHRRRACDRLPAGVAG